MADDVTLNAAAGTFIAATDEIAGKHYQRVKLTDGTAESTTPINVGNGVAANALRVTLASDGTGVVVASITSTVPGTGATNLGKAEDAAHASGDTGVMALAVRNDAGAALAATTGDYIPLSTDNVGALRVAITSGAGSGGTSIADEAAFTLASTSVTPIAAVYNSTPDTLATGKAGALQMTTARALHVHVVDVAGAPISPDSIATIDSITAKIATDVIQNGLIPLTPKFAVIQHGTSGDNTIVAAVASKKIRVLAYNFISSGAVNAKFQSGASGTDKTGLKYCVANTGISVNFCPVGLFETDAGVLLNLNLSAPVPVGGEIVYVEI